MPSSLAGWRDSRSYLLTLAVFALAFWAELSLHRVTSRFTFMAFAPAVAIAAWSGGVLPAMLAVACSVVASDYFLLGPGQLLDFDNLPETAALCAFAIGWSAVGALAGSHSRRIQIDGGRRQANGRAGCVTGSPAGANDRSPRANANTGRGDRGSAPGIVALAER